MYLKGNRDSVLTDMWGETMPGDKFRASLFLLLECSDVPYVAIEAMLQCHKYHQNHSLFSVAIVLVTACLEQVPREIPSCSCASVGCFYTKLAVHSHGYMYPSKREI